ncbi:hypothetical protein P389DRAFT_180385 [Cystobasidium minutum MCA 4210]|uniref:uncharacterized protein n=1 Tax=Cystobasidium minutum MCA 4210 TaxID=1397322 RepID=UPI0034CE026B|eukprot:jgi/Rhomi1/180385/fgenesh1_pg.4_\
MQVSTAYPRIVSSPQMVSRQAGAPPASTTATHSSYMMEGRASTPQDSQMSSTAPPVLPAESSDPMYAGLPTYRFPAGPSRSGSVPASQPNTPVLFTFPNKSALPEAPPADAHYDERMQFSPAVSPVPSLQTSSSTLSSVASHSLLKPALPIITFPNSPMPDYEVENVYPSGMVGHAEPPYSMQHDPTSYQASPSFPSTSQWAPLSPTKVIASPAQVAPQTPGRFPDFSDSHRLKVEYSPANVSPTTYLPSSAYLPSTGTFTGPTMSGGNVPRSAPSTPLGRQDARFLGKSGWPAQTLPNPFPFNAPQTEPRMRTDFGQAYHSQPAFPQTMSGYYSAEEQERDASPGMLSFNASKASGSPDSRYIPYARGTKGFSSSQNKRSPPRALDLSVSKKARRATENETNTVNQLPAFLTDAMMTETKSKQTRCRIACGACRKTRLKCDGENPCTSCVEKRIKAHPSETQADAAAAVRAEGTCVYENFVRRRGKGKKTLDKERQQSQSIMEQGSRSGSSEYSSHPAASLLDSGLHIQSIEFRPFN